MIRSSCIALAVLVPAGAAAQPLIDSDNMPNQGDHVVISEAPGTDPGQAGDGVTWDMSGLFAQSELEVEFVDPATTPAGGDFPDATLCRVEHFPRFDTYSYMMETADSVFVVGTATTSGSAIYEDFAVLFPLPWQYGTQFQDTFEGTSNESGSTIETGGDVDFVADGRGTLVLPSGTVEDAVRYHATFDLYNGSLSIAAEQWVWYSPEHRSEVLAIQYVQGIPSSTRYVKDLDGMTPTRSVSVGGIKSMFR